MTVLVIDDEKSIRMSLTLALKKVANQVLSAENGKKGIELFRNNEIDLVYLDIKLPDIDGIEVLKQIKQINRKAIVVMMTHLIEVKLAVRAMKLGAHDYYTKPFSIEEVLNAYNQIKEYVNSKVDIDSNNESDIFIGNEENILEIKSRIKRIATINFQTNVLITGESGTGKELIARSIHKNFDESKPFIAINCAAIPKHLQESELFGHEKGAFSDAKAKRTGLFELSEDGILFLDEIGDMDLDLQAKLLRVLQERKFRRIGGNEEVAFNATIVAATNKNLKRSIEKGQFRSDLYYRLNIIPIEIPPLRDRKNDIPVLCRHFVAFYNDLLDKEIMDISKDAMDIFQKYDWPGNVRELKNIIERLMILSDGNLLTADEMPYELTNEDYKTSRSDLSHLEQAEQEVVLRALSEYHWNITKTAESLGISRLTLRRKIDKYGLSSHENLDRG